MLDEWITMIMRRSTRFLFASILCMRRWYAVSDYIGVLVVLGAYPYRK